jgi:hypothetical protein
MILAGVPEALLAVRAGERTFSVVAGGGEPVLRPFDKGSELQPRLDELMAGPQRQPTASDLEFS